MSDKCNNCPSQAGCSTKNEEQCQPAHSLLGSLNQIHNVIVVMSGKGGVGKSSVSALLAAALNRHGKKVGVFDADITGPSQPKAFGLSKVRMKAGPYGLIPPQTASGIKVISINFFLPQEDEPIMWRGPMMGGVLNQFWAETDWREIDYLIVDLPPGTGDVPLTIMNKLPVSGVIMVSAPQELVLMVVRKTIKMAQKLQIPILGLIENMSYAICPECGEKLEIFGKSQGEEAARQAGIEFLGGLPWDRAVNMLADEGRIEAYQSYDINELAQKIINDMES